MNNIVENLKLISKKEKLKLQLEVSNLLYFYKNKYNSKDKMIFWIDTFCGAGGTSTGIHFSKTNSFVLACVNHDENAIKSHFQNHPNTIHFTEDITDFNVVLKLSYIAYKFKKAFPNCEINLWGSLECTNFSIAKGGQSRDADSRSLADHMPLYLEYLNPTYFYVENVKEFLDWGPLRIKEGKKESSDYSVLQLDKKGRFVNIPVQASKGVFYKKWRDKIMRLGYKYDHKKLNAADFGSVQSRERLFVQFSKPNYQISYPKPTHGKIKKENQLNLFEINSSVKPHRAVREVLDLDDEGKSIFNRKKQLADNTIKVIINGILKAIIEGESGIMFKYYGNGDNLNPFSKPSGTVTTKDRFAIIKMIFNQYKTGSITSINKPLGAITTNPKANVLSFIMNPSHFGHTTSINKPSPTIIARQDKAPLYIIKALMDELDIIDIKMRMVKISELKQIQGFPIDYKLIGNQTQQKKYIGNAVDVHQAKALIIENYQTIFKNAAAA